MQHLKLLSVFLLACVDQLPVEHDDHHADSKHPVDDKGRPIPGWRGTIPLPTPAPAQFWVDTDGVAPEVPGCHYAYKNEPECIEQEGGSEIVGWIGEECRDGLLVETNPGAGVCHEHENAQGKPDTFDCLAYCHGHDNGYHWGRCIPVADVCDGKDGKKIASAKCECGYGEPPAIDKADKLPATHQPE
jgi:hypothetical protein